MSDWFYADYSGGHSAARPWCSLFPFTHGVVAAECCTAFTAFTGFQLATACDRVVGVVIDATNRPTDAI